MTDLAKTMRPAGTAGVAFMRGVRSFALLRESGAGMVGVGLIGFWVIIAILVPLIAPFDPNATLQPFAKPGTAYAGGGTFWLGTDQIGRDILSRIMWGSRTVLFYAPVATASAYLVGIVMGLAAGYYRGRADSILSFVANVILSFPVLVLYILVITTIGASGINIVIAITFASAPGIMRIVRGLVLDLRNRDYVAAAQTRGESSWYIMLVEILPNARGPAHRRCLPAPRLRDHHHRRPRLSRPRPAAARPRLGRDDQRGPAAGPGFSLHDHLSMYRHFIADPRLQHARRRLARNIAEGLN